MRNDHWSGLFAEVLVVLLPWNPLAWWARHRLAELSELACDDWALAAGVAADDYAESLLGLTPQRRTALAPSAVSSRRGLIGRIQLILADRRIVPTVGWAWGLASAAVVSLAVTAVALAQARPAMKETQSQDAPPSTRKDVPQPAQATKGTRHVVRGVVLRPDGSPAAGAHLTWLGEPKGRLTALGRAQGPGIAVAAAGRDHRQGPRR